MLRLTVFSGEFFVEDAFAIVGFFGPAAFGEPELPFHDKLHGVDAAADGRMAGEDDAVIGVGRIALMEFHTGLAAAHEDGEEENVVGIERAIVLGVSEVGGEVGGGVDFFEGVGVEEVVGV